MTVVHSLLPGGHSSRLATLSVAAILLLAQSRGAAAFPLVDPSNTDQVPQGTELATPDAQDLRHQLQMVNGLAAPPGGGWTVVPRIDVQGLLTDNVLQAHAPRDFDLATFIAPGIHIAGDMPRLKLSFDFAPTLAIYARTPSLDALTEQIEGLATVTVVQDLAFVDVRAIAGVHNLYGGLGTFGGATNGAGTQQAIAPSLAGDSLGLNRNNEVQTDSFGISPYLLHQFGDWGTARLGYSFNATQSQQLQGFASSPFPTGGPNSQTLVSNEEVAHFVTGDFLQPLQNSFDVDFLQSQITDGAALSGASADAASFTATRDFISDKVTYQFNRAIAVFASGGHEDIVYSLPGQPKIHDLTWSFGTTLTPSPDATLTVSYGHLNGFNSVTADGRYAITGRTTLTFSYGSSIGTQLENLQSQINLATASSNGSLVNGQTGGALFGNVNALAVQNGVFRYDTLAAGLQTWLDRDSISINLLQTKETNESGGAGSSGNSTVVSVNGQWLHQLRPNLILSGAASYAVQTGLAGASSLGNSTSIAVSIGLQEQISDTISASLRYTFFDRLAAEAAFSYYQNMLILGITKSF